MGDKANTMPCRERSLAIRLGRSRIDLNRIKTHSGRGENSTKPRTLRFRANR